MKRRWGLVLAALFFSFSFSGCTICLSLPNPLEIVRDLASNPSGTEVIFGTHQKLEQLFYDPNRLKPSKLFNGALEEIAAELKTKNVDFAFVKIEDSASVVKAKKHFASEYKKAEVLNASINNSVKLEFAALTGLLKSIESSHTGFITPERLQEFNSSDRGKSGYSGIGLSLQKLEDDFYYVDWVVPNGPAAQAGVQKFDRLLKIEETEVPNDTKQITKLLRGKEKSSVNILIERKGQILDFKITRREFDLHSVSSRYLNLNGRRVVYIEFHNFTSNAVSELKKIIQRAQNEKTKGIILDLRGNRGGEVSALTTAFSFFIKGDASVFITRKLYQEQEIVVSGKSLTDLPLVIMVDNGSASASEIMAGALQEKNRAVLVGKKTSGMVEVSTIIKLYLGAAMSVAIYEVFTPNGEILEKIGVKPNKEAQLSKEDIINAHDSQLEVALVELVKLTK